MENRLKKLFDYQQFEQNERLEKLIRETDNRYAAELSDDDLALVNAAGEVAACPETIDGNDIWGKGQQGEILLPRDKK